MKIVNYKKIGPSGRKNGNNFTMPWHPDEYIYIDGQPYVYTGSWIESILVRFPGGHADYADMLLARYGVDRVVYPLKPRLQREPTVQNLNNSK